MGAVPKEPSCIQRAAAGKVVLLLAGLLAATLAAYQPAWRGGMLWDDDRHVTRADLRTLEGLRRIWFELGATQQYYPLAHTAFWVQHRLWGSDTLGYHLTNIVLHALSAFLVGLILRRLTLPGAWLAAAIFALHPVHAESVAWISELKNTLSGTLYLCSALAYLHYDEHRKKRHYALALALFVLALLSKTVTATLPAALLVVFWWRRGGLGWRKDSAPLVPFFVLGAAGGTLTAWVERTLIGAEGAEFDFTLLERLSIAGRAIWFYLGKLVWPADLTFIYPRWEIGGSTFRQYAYPCAAALLLAALWRLRKRTRGPLAAMLYFCGTLFPVLGFFNVYPFRFSFVADHFQYLASIGVIALAAASAARLARRAGVPAAARVWASAALCAVLALLTWNQARRYSDAETLYRAVLRSNPSCWLAHVNLGILRLGIDRAEAESHFAAALRLKPDLAEAYINLGLPRFRENVALAQEYFRQAVRLRPDSPEAHNNLGCALERMGYIDEALAHFDQALHLRPDYPDALYNRGNALLKAGRLPEAAEHYRRALRLRPEAAEVRCKLGDALRGMGRLEEAIAEYGEALRRNPDYLPARFGLGYTLHEAGRLEEAVTQYTLALAHQPDSAEIHNNLGAALERLGRLEEAVEHFGHAIRSRPDSAEIRNNMAFALHRLGRLEEAAAQYREALRLDPNYPLAGFRLGTALHRLGRLEEAVQWYKHALAALPGSADIHNNLGAALEVQGRLGEAAQHYREAVRLDPTSEEARENLERISGIMRARRATGRP